MKVHLIASSHFDVEGFLAFLRDQGTSWRQSPEAMDAEQIVEVAGRICYMSFGDRQSPRTNQEYIRHLIRMGHESVLEHVTWTFLITGVSRAFTHQLVRHRVGFAFSQLSQQYHDESGAEFIEPSQLGLSAEAREAWSQAMESAQRAYRVILNSLEENAVKSLEPKELSRSIHTAARSVMPNATETKIVVTANARALRHFLRTRGAIPGDEEMRRVAAELLRQLKLKAPSIFCDFRCNTLADGSPIVLQEGQG
jgi:thymidylate synthase (FAD)